MIICIDFDGVIHQRVPQGRTMGPPIEGAKEKINLLKEQGNTIVIYSNRVKDYKDTEHIMQWLDYYEIGFDFISVTKPNADIYIDDKGYRFENWDDTYIFIHELSRSKYA